MQFIPHLEAQKRIILLDCDQFSLYFYYVGVVKILQCTPPLAVVKYNNVFLPTGNFGSQNSST